MTNVFVTRDTTRVVVPYRSDLASLIPHARPFDFQGERMLVMPNAQQEARLCRNLGVTVPAPILTRYDWRGSKPWGIQRTTAALLTESERAYVLSTMGTGKTRSVIYAADFLIRAGVAKRFLIVAPLSTLTPVWEKELFDMMMRDRRVRVLHGDRKKRLRLLAEDAEFYVINHHGLALIQKELCERGFDGVVIDELATFRTKGTTLWKAANTVVNAPGVQWVWGLTGSPTPTAPTDAWAQIRLLTPARTVRSMVAFREQTMQRLTQFKYIPRKEANDIVFAAMQPSVRFTRDDVMELPPTSYVDRAVKLDDQAAKAYKMMFDKMRMHTHDGQSITAVNEGVLQNKLLQVACGYIYTDKRGVYALPNGGRLAALDQTISETDRKVIVFVPYLHALDGVAKHLRDHKHNVAVIHGGIGRGVRDKIFANFQNASHPLRILVAHPQCMSHGLTLTAANTIVWFAPTQSLEIYEQANARITRPGQTAKTLIAHLFGTTVEKATYTRLKTRARMQGVLLDMFKQQELEF